MKTKKERSIEALMRVALVLSLLLGAAAFTAQVVDWSQVEPASVGAQSASGYLFRLEDGTGTEKFSVDDSGNADVAGTLNSDGGFSYGSNSMYPLGYATTGQELVCATTTITGANQTITVTGITTVTYGFAWLITDPGSGAGDPYIVTTDSAPGDSTIVVNVWQDDVSAATSGASIGYCALGNE